MKFFVGAVLLVILAGCGGSDGNDDDCFTLRDDQYCKVETNG